MSADRKKPGVASWAIVAVVVLLVAYPLSFGPACWIASRPFDTGKARRIPTFYWPVQTYVPYCPGGQAAIAWYVMACVPAGSDVLVPFHDRDGKLAWVRYAEAPPRGIDPGGL